MSYIVLVIQSTISRLVCRLILVWDRIFLLLLRTYTISVRFLHLLSLSFFNLARLQVVNTCLGTVAEKVYKWLKVDWENLGSCHRVIEFIAGKHTIYVEYQSE
jgi:hypothetical protein